MIYSFYMTSRVIGYIFIKIHLHSSHMTLRAIGYMCTAVHPHNSAGYCRKKMLSFFPLYTPIVAIFTFLWMYQYLVWKEKTSRKHHVIYVLSLSHYSFIWLFRMIATFCPLDDRESTNHVYIATVILTTLIYVCINPGDLSCSFSNWNHHKLLS